MSTTRLVAGLGLLAVLVGAAGCTDGDGGTAAPPPTTAAPTTPEPSAGPTTGPTTGTPDDAAPTTAEGTRPATDRCHTSELTASFGRLDPGAGQRYGTVVLANRSGRTCTVLGFGGLQPLDAAGRQLPVRLTREGPAPTPVRLVPGARVTKTVHFTVVSGDGGCPTPASVAVTPPDETDPIVVAWPYGEICGDRIDGTAYRAG